MVSITEKTEKPWPELSPEEKLERRFEAWLSAEGIDFATPEAEEVYRAAPAEWPTPSS